MEDSMEMDMSPLRPQNFLFALEEDAESDDEEEDDMKLLNMSGKRSAPGVGSKVPQKKVKLSEEDEEDDEDEDDDDDDDFEDEESEEKTPPVKKSGQDSFKKQDKTPKGPTSLEDIKAKMQASIEKGGSLPKVEGKFINCFRMSDQEAIQDLWLWRKSL
ncbi:nucleophosmin-like isoform X3 [Gracilinanus agilis]|uniref:nucleophosmin-like isoform X3 n=1 Tax=Gracilinanus agilis TaxID=191870 RepID=UPI001CFDB801|nr:nucleophosmin-like isoform X3 [Gracilinanus agilis]